MFSSVIMFSSSAQTSNIYTRSTLGMLHVGDVIKEINGQEVKDPDVLMELMRKATGSITMKVIPSYFDQSSISQVSNINMSLFITGVLKRFWSPLPVRIYLLAYFPVKCSPPVFFRFTSSAISRMIQ